MGVDRYYARGQRKSEDQMLKPDRWYRQNCRKCGNEFFAHSSTAKYCYEPCQPMRCTYTLGEGREGRRARTLAIADDKASLAEIQAWLAEERKHL